MSSSPHILVRPGWPEIAVAAPLAALLYLVGGGLASLLPEDFPLAPGLTAFALSGLVPLIAVAAAVLLRTRRLAPFGVRRFRARWAVIAVGVAAAAFALSWPVSWLFDPLFPADVQASYRDAAAGGTLPFLGTIALGGLLTPLGEELLFRGVVTRFLQRWGTPIAVIAGALVFALAHGVNSVMPTALLIGIANGLLLRGSGSIWPGVIVHVLFNSGGMVYHALAGG